MFVLCAVSAGLLFAQPGRDSVGQTARTKSTDLYVEVFDSGTAGGRTDITNNPWTEWIKEKLLKDENISIHFVAVPRSQEIEDLNNLMAAGNPPDICYTYSVDTISNYRDQGGLFDMAPYVDSLLPDLKILLGPDTAVPGRDLIYRTLDSSTGKLFSIPAKRTITAQRNIFIRKDWLDKLGLPLPKTTQEYYDALLAFKENDPGGVGKDKVIPFIMTTDVRWEAANIMDPFIDPNLSLKERWINTVVERNLLLPGFKEGVRFMNKMFNAGLIDRDFPLYAEHTPVDNLIKSGVVGSVSGDWALIYRDVYGHQDGLRQNVPDGNFVPIDCIQSSDGITHKGAYDPAGIFYFIPSSSKVPEVAMRYLNWLAKYENYHFLQVGQEGIVHDMVNGVPKLRPASEMGRWIQNSSQNIYYTMPLNGIEMGNPELNVRTVAAGFPFPEQEILNAYNVAMTNAKPEPVIPVTLFEAGSYTQTLQDKAKVLFVNAIIASPNQFDRVWDDGIADWLRSGAQAIVDERRAKFVAP
jgi:putative aldouronate transport system substrate-binding protein